MSFFNLNDINSKINQRHITESVSYKSLSDSVRIAKSSNKSFDIFLSHSYLDSNQILVIKEEIESLGFSVYVDWIEDKQLDRTKVNKETALLLKDRMGNCKSLFFAATPNYTNSKWMPWELGYFDGFKGKVVILPILDKSNSSYKGSEYLELYPYIDKATIKGTSTMKLWVNDSDKKYVELSDWLAGKEPYLRN